ncbi:MAG TPA: acyl-CoA dehydrogenase family protein [Fimbriimonadaceae bacterium]|nr:acyl-CoA dehydrogenase family protein [Fimbriimonadaceae bacterium]HRJ32390.1 acyl-CoA dehydrogenase family protein [Fimbriimonadaceae bacterium]
MISPQAECEILAIAEAYLESEVRPNAAALDSEPEALRRALHGLAERELLALRRPEVWGGPALSDLGVRTFQEAVARSSGALAFLQTQHQSAAGMIAKSTNAELQAATLPKMANGERLIGIGFSQLRRSGPPLMQATPEPGGYRLQGHVPWVTGFGFFPEFLIGASLETGESVLGLVPFVPARSPDGGEIQFSPPMRLAAMESAQTVTADLTRWFLPHEAVVFVQPARWIQLNDQINITLQGWFAMGCTRGSLDILEEAAQRKKNQAIGHAAESLLQEWEELRHQLLQAQAGSEETTQERLELRAWAIELCVRAAHAAIAATGGSANSAGHPAQRLFREALVYTVSAQTEPIQTATLDRLIQRQGPRISTL